MKPAFAIEIRGERGWAAMKTEEIGKGNITGIIRDLKIGILKDLHEKKELTDEQFEKLIRIQYEKYPL